MAGTAVDLRGRRIHRLVALEPLDQRDAKGNVMWRCRCDCGRETIVSYNALMYGNMKSCGCRKREHERTLGSYLNHVDGTSIEMLQSSKVPTNNTSGVRGVYFSHGKYCAKMVIKGRQYHLGRFVTVEEAAAARREAEETIHRQLIAAWQEWRSQPGKQPFSFHVQKDKQNRLMLIIDQEEGRGRV